MIVQTSHTWQRLAVGRGDAGRARAAGARAEEEVVMAVEESAPASSDSARAISKPRPQPPALSLLSQGFPTHCGSVSPTAGAAELKAASMNPLWSRPGAPTPPHTRTTCTAADGSLLRSKPR